MITLSRVSLENMAKNNVFDTERFWDPNHSETTDRRRTCIEPSVTPESVSVHWNAKNVHENTNHEATRKR